MTARKKTDSPAQIQFDPAEIGVKLENLSVRMGHVEEGQRTIIEKLEPLTNGSSDIKTLLSNHELRISTIETCRKDEKITADKDKRENKRVIISVWVSIVLLIVEAILRRIF